MRKHSEYRPTGKIIGRQKRRQILYKCYELMKAGLPPQGMKWLLPFAPLAHPRQRTAVTLDTLCEDTQFSRQKYYSKKNAEKRAKVPGIWSKFPLLWSPCPGADARRFVCIPKLTLEQGTRYRAEIAV